MSHKMAPKRKLETLSEPDLNTVQEHQQQHPTKVRRTSSRSDKEKYQSASQSPSLKFETPAQAQDPEFEGTPAPSSAPLTRKNLRLLETMTGSKGPNSAKTGSAPSAYAASTADTAKTGDSKKSLATTDQGFEEAIRRNGIPEQWRTQITRLPNQDEIEARLNASRASASPTVSFYQVYVEAASDAGNEVGTVDALNRGVLKDTRWDSAMVKEKYRAQWDKQWTDYPKDVGFNNGLSAPKPDYIEGYTKQKFPPTIEKIGGAATLVKQTSNFIALPHFALEAKAAGKNMHLAQVQAQYDGAAMVYGRNQALAYIQQPDPPETPKVATLIADGENWDAFLHYEHKDEKTKETTYRTHGIAGGDLRSYESYKQGYKQIRNLQDMMRENATDLKDRLQEDYDEHGLRTTGRSSVASSARGLSATQSRGSGGSVQSGPAKSPATAPRDTPSASSRASSSGSRVAQLKADPSPRKAPSSASASSERADSASGSLNNDRRTDRYRDRDDSPASLQRRRSDSPDRSRPPQDRDQRRPRSRDERVQSEKAEPQKSYRDERRRDQDGRVSVRDGQRLARDDAARPQDATKPIVRDNSIPPKKQTKPPVRDDEVSPKNTTKSDNKASLGNTSKPSVREDKRSPSDERTPIQGDRRPERSYARDDTRSSRDQKATIQEYRTPERSSASGSSTSSGSRVLDRASVDQPVKTRHETLKRSENGKSDRVNAPTTDALYSRRW